MTKVKTIQINSEQWISTASSKTDGWSEIHVLVASYEFREERDQPLVSDNTCNKIILKCVPKVTDFLT